MTQLDVVYRYGVPPTEAAMLAMAKVRDVYGVRKLDLREAEKTVRVEYDRAGDPPAAAAVGAGYRGDGGDASRAGGGGGACSGCLRAAAAG
jgi:hypothetical protein